MSQINDVSVVTAISASGLSRLGWECTVVTPRHPASACEAAEVDA
jgi:hypothetical protein